MLGLVDGGTGGWLINLRNKRKGFVWGLSSSGEVEPTRTEKDEKDGDGDVMWGVQW